MIVLKKNSNCFMMKIKNSYIPIEDTLIKYLTEEISIEKGVTFEDFFNIIMKNHEEYSLVFNSHLGGVNLSVFLNEWQKEPDDEKSAGIEKMEKIVISWDDITLFHKNDLTENGLDIYFLPSFFGIGKQDEENVSFGLEFTPINNLKKYPLELTINCKVIDVISQKELFKINRVLTVYDVLSAIFYEITYCGTPEMRNETLSDLKERIEDVNKDFDADGNFIGEDETKYKHIDEVMDDLRKKITEFEKDEEQEEFDEYGHRKIKSNEPTNLDDILKKLNIDKPKE